jgi:nicotinate-nucleotide--dimethylbenzimidazole phosphoribosyltransferase
MTTESQPLWQPPLVLPLNQELEAAMRARIDGKAKPLGSQGRIEELAVRLGMIAHPAAPKARRPSGATDARKYRLKATPRR